MVFCTGDGYVRQQAEGGIVKVCYRPRGINWEDTSDGKITDGQSGTEAKTILQPETIQEQ